MAPQSDVLPVWSEGTFGPRLPREKPYSTSECIGITYTGPGKLKSRSVGAGPAATASKVPESKTVVVWVEIEGARVQALVDSGADFSMWRRGAVPANLLVGADDWDAGPLVMAKDELMWPVGKVEGVVEFEEMKRRLNGIAIVDSSPFAVILGNDWLEAMDAMVGYRKGQKGILVGQEMFVAGKRRGAE